MLKCNIDILDNCATEKVIKQIKIKPTKYFLVKANKSHAAPGAAGC